MTEPAYLGGRLLLAMPGMGDPNFDHAVIAMIAHDANGAMGIGFGQVRDEISFHAVLQELDIEPGAAPDCPVHHGGPVEPGRGFILHSAEWQGEDTIPAKSFGAISASLEILRAIAAGTGPKQWLIALGYAGWGAGQLDAEMQRHGWHAATGRAEILFDHSAEKRWKAAWQAEGIDPALLANTTGTA